MTSNKECEFPCPFQFSDEIAGVCPSSGINDFLDALDLCQQVMLGRRRENELKNGGKLPVTNWRDPRIVEYRGLEVEDLDEEEMPELKVSDAPFQPHDAENPTIFNPKKKRRNIFKETFQEEL